jgi:hypothetical protein
MSHNMSEGRVFESLRAHLRNDRPDNSERRYRLFFLARLESATPARTHSSTSEILNFQSRPIRWAGKLRRSIQR